MAAADPSRGGEASRVPPGANGGATGGPAVTPPISRAPAGAEQSHRGGCDRLRCPELHSPAGFSQHRYKLAQHSGCPGPVQALGCTRCALKRFHTAGGVWWYRVTVDRELVLQKPSLGNYY